MWGIVAAVCLSIVAVSYWIMNHIIRPVSALTEAAEAIASGDYTRRVYVENRDELGTLARALNRTSQELDARMKHVGRTGDRQATVLGGMIEGVIAVDERQRIVLANRAAGQLFDFPPAAAERRPLMEIVRNHALHETVSRALASGQTQRLEIRREASERKSAEIHVQPLPGRPCPGAVLVIHDTTELRRLESLRRDFIANVSHELKTPLTSIKACAETLRDGALRDPEASQRFLARIDEQADRLHHLILDMLMLARIESEQQVFEVTAVDLPQAVADCLESHRPAADARRIRLAVDENQPACSVLADREGLREILDNLVDNAVKYTPEGGEVIVSWSEERGTRCEEERSSPQSPVPSPQPPASSLQPLVRIVVRDTGIGIKPEDQLRVFERFYRVDKARSRELGGTGLGLAIVKHMVHSFGGNVSVQSEPGKGSAFTVELPSA
jgi:two-component system phosphate regulon sensor histidine kinase PhoR